MKYSIIVLFILTVVFIFSKKDPEKTMLTSQNTILAFGDSITYGYGVNPLESYPSVLASLSKHTVINAGVNGDTSEDGLARLSPLLKDKSIKLMILCFGGNDILQNTSMSTLARNLKTMIHMAKKHNIEVLLISVPNVSIFGLSALELYENLATEENVPLLNGVLADILSNPSHKIDQIHPNALGYKIMGEEIYTKLKAEGILKD